MVSATSSERADALLDIGKGVGVLPVARTLHAATKPAPVEGRVVPAAHLLLRPSTSLRSFSSVHPKRVDVTLGGGDGAPRPVAF